MSDSQSHEMDEEPIIYEEEEVLWAKIRGYPWWPAFVDKVHGANSHSDDEIYYTVFFFGDNTQYCASKLRRFLDFYTEFFPKAKTNRKLYLSIMKAEEKLKQNGGNIEIFQTLRNSLKKSKKGRGHHKTQSKISSEDHVNNLSQEPELIRNKTFPNHDQKQGKQIISSQQIIAEEEKPYRRRGRKSRKVIEKQEQEKQEKKEIESASESSEEEKEIQLPKVLNYRTRSGRTRNQTSKIQQSKSEKSEQQKESSSQSQKEEPNKKNHLPRLAQKTKPIGRHAPKKRGRPKKVVEEPQESSSEGSQEEESQKSENNKSIILSQQPPQQNETRKTRLQRKIQQKPRQFQNKIPTEKQKIIVQSTQKCETSEHTKQLIIERVKFCLDKRNQLIEYLDELNITTEFVKEILDLDVTTIVLQGGEMTQEAIRVLQKLKSVLLHRYFPQDIKIRKKYEKLTKKAQSLKTNPTQNEESLQDLQLRRKTLIKLQKILRNIENSADQREKAIKIQQYFRKYDESIGTGYKTIAYRVLRSLKDKNHLVDEIMAKLEAGDFDQENR